MEAIGRMWGELSVGPAAAATPWQVLDGIQTLEERLVATVGIVVLTFVLVALVMPRLSRALTRDTEDEESDSEQRAGAIRSGVILLLVRVVQLGLLTVAVMALVVVWDRVDQAWAFLFPDGQPVALFGNVVITLAVGLVAYVAIDVLDDAVARFSEGADRVTEHQQEVIQRVGQLGIAALALFAVLTIWVDDLSGLLVGAGFLGIVVGMAARQTLGSLIAGLVLMFSRPFTIGDWVEIGDQDGIVSEITIFNTRLENFDGEFIVIPNDIVGNQPITNRSRKGHLRIRENVGIDYDSDPELAREVALEAMTAVDAVEPSPSPQAILTEFGDSAITVELRFWIERPTPPRMWRATNAVVEAVKTAFDREGIKIPYPQRELTGRAETGGLRIHRDGAPAQQDGDDTPTSAIRTREDGDDVDDGEKSAGTDEPSGGGQETEGEETVDAGGSNGQTAQAPDDDGTD